MHKALLTLPCKIRRSAFSGERIVLLTLGGEEYKTIAPVHYCRTSSGQELTELFPPSGEEIDGNVKVFANITENGAVLALPDGEFINLTRNDVEDFLAA